MERKTVIGALSLAVIVAWLLPNDWTIPVRDFFERFETLAVILGSGGVAFAALSYLHQKKNDQKISLADLISFFRKDVADLCFEFDEFIDREGLYFSGKSVAGVIIDVENDRPRPGQELRIQHQQKIIDHSYKARNNQTRILNALEEFSLRVKITETINCEELVPLKSGFIFSVDRCAVWLFEQRRMISRNKVFSNTLRLYKEWQKDIERS